MVPDKPKAALPLPPNPEAQTSRPDMLSQQGEFLEKALLSAVSAILDHAEELDDWDQRWTGLDPCCIHATFVSALE